MNERLLLPSTLLVAGRVLLDSSATNIKRAFEEIGLAFENTEGPSRGKIFKHLLDRERLGSTAIGPGVAVPHARIRTLTTPLAAYLRVREPILFDSPDIYVRHMFVVLAPDKADKTHLQILSLVSQLFKDEIFVAKIEACTIEKTFIALVRDFESRYINYPTSQSSTSG